jgi:hypothetical protein
MFVFPETSVSRQDGNGPACDTGKTGCPLLHQKLKEVKPINDAPRYVEEYIEWYACGRVKGSAVKTPAL